MDDKQPGQPGISEATAKRQEIEAQRLAKALRDNLARRKAQSRGRSETDDTPQT